VIILYLVRFLLKISNKIELKKQIETGSNQPVSVRFFRIKIGSNRFDLVLSSLTRFINNINIQNNLVDAYMIIIFNKIN